MQRGRGSDGQAGTRHSGGTRLDATDRIAPGLRIARFRSAKNRAVAVALCQNLVYGTQTRNIRDDFAFTTEEIDQHAGATVGYVYHPAAKRIV